MKQSGTIGKSSRTHAYAGDITGSPACDKPYAHRWLARICQQDAAVTSNATSSGQQSAAATHDAIASISQHCAEVTSDAMDRRAVVTTQTDTISRCLSLQATAWEMNCSSRPDSSPIPASSRKTMFKPCLLYTSPSPRDRQKSRMPSSA